MWKIKKNCQILDSISSVFFLLLLSFTLCDCGSNSRDGSTEETSNDVFTSKSQQPVKSMYGQFPALSGKWGFIEAKDGQKNSVTTEQDSLGPIFFFEGEFAYIQEITKEGNKVYKSFVFNYPSPSTDFNGELVDNETSEIWNNISISGDILSMEFHKKQEDGTFLPISVTYQRLPDDLLDRDFEEQMRALEEAVREGSLSLRNHPSPGSLSPYGESRHPFSLSPHADHGQ